MAAKILLIEDDKNLSELIKSLLVREGYEVLYSEDGNEGKNVALRQHIDAVISDVILPGINGLELLRQIQEKKPRLPVILMTGQGTTDMAIEATKSGAYDYLLKPFKLPDLLELLSQAVTSSRIISEPVDIGTTVSQHDAIIGKSRAMQEVFKQIGRVAAKSVTVMVRGETGTGKELIARAIVQHSKREDSPFITVNCAAIPETLLESELFGHEKGAFTGADSRRIGRFEQANGGTIFLDEIGEMSFSTQAKLLRVLQEKTIQRLGSKETIDVDARVIAATHRDLEEAVQKKNFREDLYYRLSVVVINIPALRERVEDVPALIHYFLQRCSRELEIPNPSIQPEALEFFKQQHWPGNVRQLENAVRKAMLGSRGYPIRIDEAKRALDVPLPNVSPNEKSLQSIVSDHILAASRGEKENILSDLTKILEKEVFAQSMQAAGGNQAKAARWLGVSLPKIRERLIQYDLHPRKTSRKKASS